VGALANRKRPGTVVHRGASLGEADVMRHHGIPVTTRSPPSSTSRPRSDELEAAINEADKRDAIRFTRQPA
jgi:hypothetical protein